jgi:DNA-binding MarR family transcriptional regulator
MPQPELGNLPEMLGVELRIAQILADRVFNVSQQAGLAPGHYTVLSLIKLNPGINQSELARCMYLDRSTMVPLIDQLQTRGWVERRPHSVDRRAYALHLTRKGQALLKRADIEVTELELSISQNLGQQQREHLLQLLKQLQEVLRETLEGSTGAQQ